jgi:hemoglobin
MSALPDTLFHRLGGNAGLERLAASLYRWMDQLPGAADVHAMHRMPMPEVEARLAHFLSGFFGGQDEYRSRYGEPMMRRRHFPFPIGAAERDAWLECMRHALEETVEEPQLRVEAYAQIARFAEHMRNRD